MTDDLIPVMPAAKLLNPALIRFVGANPDSRPVVEVGGQHHPVKIVSYDEHTNEVVIGVGDPDVSEGVGDGQAGLVRCRNCRDLAVSHDDNGCSARTATPIPCRCRATRHQVLAEHQGGLA